jgi:electron transport complex protein RnfB
MSASLASRIDALLPQTQCTKCGFSGCRPYAEALASGETEINRCPPGGPAGISRLAALLERPALPLDPACGEHLPLQRAHIDPTLCIGCTKCIQACPVDAIIGARKRMHTIAADLCTGCELCIPPCPVDCIVMSPSPAPIWTDDDAQAARARHLARGNRLERERARRQARLAARGTSGGVAEHGRSAQTDAAARKHAMIEAAMQRAQARLQRKTGGSSKP